MGKSLQKKMAVNIIRELNNILIQNRQIKFIGIYPSKKINYRIENNAYLIIGCPLDTKEEIEQFLWEKNRMGIHRRKKYKIEYQNREQDLFKRNMKKEKDDEDGTGGSKGTIRYICRLGDE